MALDLQTALELHQIRQCGLAGHVEKKEQNGNIVKAQIALWIWRADPSSGLVAGRPVLQLEARARHAFNRLHDVRPPTKLVAR